MEKFFVPQEDITAYELAVIMLNLPAADGQSLRCRQITFRDWESLPKKIRRHFADKPALMPMEGLP